MLVIDFFQWWYGRGWRGVLTSNRRRLRSLAAMFSVRLILQTLFAPWRRIITAPGAGIGPHLQALGDNLVSRCIGFVVRVFVLIAAVAAFAGLAIGTVIEYVVWPLLPVGSIVLVVWGLV